MTLYSMRSRLLPFEALGLFAIVVAFVVCVGAGLAHGAPLQYDEAVYAAKSRQWLEGTPANQTHIYRPPGLPALGTVGLAFSNSDESLKAIGLLGGVLALVSLFFLGRTIAGGGAALFATGAFAASPEVQLRAAQFLNDLFAAALLFAAWAFVWRSLERPNGKGLGIAAALAAGAFYVRYASIVPAMLLALALLVVWRGRLKANPRLLIWPAATLGVLVMPHLIHSTRATGRPWGILSQATAVPSQWWTSVGDALVQYVKAVPEQLAGRLAGVLIAAALLSAAFIYRRADHHSGNTRRRSRSVAFLLFPALLQVLWLGLTAHAEKRFLFVPLGLALICGSFALSWLDLPENLWGLVPYAAALLVAVAFVRAPEPVIEKLKETSISRRPVVRAAQAIDRHSDGLCSVVSVESAVVVWYSRCATYRFHDEASLTGESFLIVRNAHPYQPAGAVLADYIAKVEPEALYEWRDPNRPWRTATVYKFKD